MSGTGLTAALIFAWAAAAAEPTLITQRSGTSNRLQAVSPVDRNVVWASGVGGTFVVTTDGGEHWRAGTVAGAGTLEFRDVQGVSADVAYLMSSGTGSDSRIYKTVDGGHRWQLQFQNKKDAAFYDCLAFWTPDRGIAFSDPVDQQFPVLRTTNGTTWQDIGNQLPQALKGESGFAASGTCVATRGSEHAWIATGGAAKARVLLTTDGGDTWHMFSTPLVSSPSGGAFTVAFRTAENGIVAGGDLDSANSHPSNRVALSSDAGKTWDLVTPPPFDGAVFGLSYVPARGRTVVITGPAGAAWSSNEGEMEWVKLQGIKGFWAVAFVDNVGWLVGTDGRILKVRF